MYRWHDAIMQITPRATVVRYLIILVTLTAPDDAISKFTDAEEGKL
jgi:hypothetical protein